MSGSVPNKIINYSFGKTILREKCLNCVIIKYRPGERGKFPPDFTTVIDSVSMYVVF